MKNSFILYTSYKEQVDLLSDEQAGVLFKAILNYANEEDLPDMDGITKIAFAFIHSQMDKDAQKYNEICEKRRDAGKQGGRPKANGSSEKQKKQMVSEESKKSKSPPDNDNDNEDDNDNDNVNESDKDISKDNNPPLSPQRGKTKADLTREYFNNQIATKNYPDSVIESMRDWIEYKIEKKQFYQERGMKSLLTIFEKNLEKYDSDSVIDVINYSMANNYTGIVWDRLSNKPQKTINEIHITKNMTYAELEAQEKNGQRGRF